ncbi:MAG: hypothetical protein IJS27_06330 [Ruminococcus sp.]|nr:hypothetical protein [Ruminococcus sp.]MBQ9516108.1 hypothetical protein [Ruminococcus sp.]
MKNSKRNIINLVFSSFLVIGYIVCTYFFSSLANQVSGTVGRLIQIAILLVFGLLLFYATRVGEGKQVKRFSLPVLLLLDIPCLYIILAAMISALPLHEQLAPADGGFPVILTLAVVALGYGIPYTFLSGYELKEDDEDEESDLVEGGIAEELAEAEAEETAQELAEEAEEIIPADNDAAEEE